MKKKPTKPKPKRRANRRRSEAALDGKVGRAAAKVSDEFSVPSSTGETKRDRKEERERETVTAKAAELGVAQVVTIGRHAVVVRGGDTGAPGVVSLSLRRLSDDQVFLIATAGCEVLSVHQIELSESGEGVESIDRVPDAFIGEVLTS